MITAAAGPTLLRPDDAHRAWASGPGSHGLPRDLVLQARVRLRVMALLYAAVFFLASFLPPLVSEASRTMLFGTVVHWLHRACRRRCRHEPSTDPARRRRDGHRL
jgi:hypothetical protein